MFGIRDGKVKEWLLRELNLMLAKTDEICHAAESMTVQMKIVEEGTDTKVNSVSAEQTSLDRFKKAMADKARECGNCGRRHEHYKELCPAYGKICRKCQKPHNFAN